MSHLPPSSLDPVDFSSEEPNTACPAVTHRIVKYSYCLAALLLTAAGALVYPATSLAPVLFQPLPRSPSSLVGDGAHTNVQHCHLLSIS